MSTFAQALYEALPPGGLFHEKTWRISPDPFFISQAFAVELDKLGYRLHKFLKACNTLYRASVEGQQPAWIAQLLDRGKPPWLVNFSRQRQFRQEIPKVLRPDLILTPDGYKITELDSVPGGMGLLGWLSAEYAQLGVTILGGASGMLEGFESILPGGDILVSAESATYRPEMEWLAEQLNARAASDCRWRVLSCAAGQKWQKSVYRFFELFDWPQIPCLPELMFQLEAGTLSLTPPLRPMFEEKIWFALFWLKPLEVYWRRELGERTFLALQKVFPYSWIVDPTPLPPHAVLPYLEAHAWEDIAHLSQKQRNLILKISGFSEKAWGSRGVVVGQDLPQRVWQEALKEALKAYEHHPYLLQRFHKGRLVEHLWWNFETQEMQEMQGRVRLCPYYFLNAERIHCAGALATLCPANKKVLHGMKEAILVPTAVKG